MFLSLKAFLVDCPVFLNLVLFVNSNKFYSFYLAVCKVFLTLHHEKFYTLLLASMVSLSVSAQNVDADKARAAQNKALRDSLSKATEVLAYHPDSIDLRLKRLLGISSWNSGNMLRMILIRYSF